ncbi:MAG: hypothetical protein AAFR91_00095 [Pseudomonadota bacterium]
MSEMCMLCNATKKEIVSFDHLSAYSPREITGSSISSPVVVWYLHRNRGDKITFLGDYDDPSSLPFSLKIEDVLNWPDRTKDVIGELVDMRILSDHGILYPDDEETDLFIYDLRNIWESPVD